MKQLNQVVLSVINCLTILIFQAREENLRLKEETLLVSSVFGCLAALIFEARAEKIRLKEEDLLVSSVILLHLTKCNGIWL